MKTLIEFLKTPIVSKILTIVIIVLVSYILIKIINKIVKRSNNKNLHIKFLCRILQSLIIMVAAAQIGMLFEVTKELITTIIASSAFLVVVLGFAAQEALSNILNGLFISIFKPFEIGDRIRITELNITGIVEDISLRHTVLRTFNNSKLLIPNSVMNKDVIENFHYNDARSGNFIDIQISYDADIDKAKSIMTNLISNHPMVIDMRSDKDKRDNKPKVSISIRELGESGIWLRGTVWTDSVDSNFSTCSELREQIIKEFLKENIKIAYKAIELVSRE